MPARQSLEECILWKGLSAVSLSSFHISEKITGITSFINDVNPLVKSKVEKANSYFRTVSVRIRRVSLVTLSQLCCGSL